MPTNSEVKDYYVCQLYEEKKFGNRKSAISIKRTILCSGPAEAEERARRSFETGSCIGADAYSVQVDHASEESTEPFFLIRLGTVPDLNYD